VSTASAAGLVQLQVVHVVQAQINLYVRRSKYDAGWRDDPQVTEDCEQGRMKYWQYEESAMYAVAREVYFEMQQCQFNYVGPLQGEDSEQLWELVMQEVWRVFDRVSNSNEAPPTGEPLVFGERLKEDLLSQMWPCWWSLCEWWDGLEV
jgi:hypothetical protein